MKLSRISFALFGTVIFLFFISACKTEHKIEVETNKPIKIEARIDIYLHAESIEDMVSGKAPVPEADGSNNKESSLFRILFCLEKEAYAEGVPIKDFTESIRQIVLQRKDRFSQIEALINKGKVKEGAKAYLIGDKDLSPKQQKLIDDENADRKALYKELAKQNGLSLKEVEKAFAKIHEKN